MQTEGPSSNGSVDDEIAKLRARFPRTQDLYREVCVLLFFRHGITPTANKLYQLVRKGSMAAPTEALQLFWTTLRERSRVTIDHTDLPDELKAATGEMVAALWKSAQTMSREALAELRAEATAAVDAAKASETQTQLAHVAVLTDLECARAKISTSDEFAGQLRQELAAAAATREGLEVRLEDLRHQVAETQLRLDRSRDDHAREREKLADRAQLAEDRFADMERRALLEIDRERTHSASLQKTLETERTAYAAAYKGVLADHTAGQLKIGELRARIGLLQNTVEVSEKERERERGDLRAIRSQVETLICEASAANTRSTELIEELARLRSSPSTRKPRPKSAAKS